MPTSGTWPPLVRTMSWWSTTPGSFRPGCTGHKDSGGQVELLLHHLPQPGGNGAVPRRPGPGPRTGGGCGPARCLNFGAELTAAVLALPEPGVAEVRFTAAAATRWPRSWRREKCRCRPISTVRPRRADRETYQTVFAAPAGAVACPTAGLHFTGAVLQDLAAPGVETVRLTLHVGPGTFMPVRDEDYTRHRMAAGILRVVRGRGGPPQRRQSGGQTPGGGGHHQHPGAGVTAPRPRDSRPSRAGATSFSIPGINSRRWTGCSPTFTCPNPPCCCW